MDSQSRLNSFEDFYRTICEHSRRMKQIQTEAKRLSFLDFHASIVEQNRLARVMSAAANLLIATPAATSAIAITIANPQSTTLGTIATANPQTATPQTATPATINADSTAVVADPAFTTPDTKSNRFSTSYTTQARKRRAAEKYDEVADHLPARRNSCLLQLTKEDMFYLDSDSEAEAEAEAEAGAKAGAGAGAGAGDANPQIGSGSQSQSKVAAKRAEMDAKRQKRCETKAKNAVNRANIEARRKKRQEQILARSQLRAAKEAQKSSKLLKQFTMPIHDLISTSDDQGSNSECDK